MFLIHDRLFMLTNNVTLVVLIDLEAGFRFASFRIVKGHGLLRGPGLAPGVNAGCFD